MIKRKAIAMLAVCLLLSGCANTPDISGEGQDSSVVSVSDSTTVSKDVVSEKENETKPEELENVTSVSLEEAKTDDEKKEEVKEEEPKEDAKVQEVTMYADFKNGCPDTFEKSGDWTNGSMFNVTWRKTSCTFEDGKMQLTIDHDKKGSEIPYSGAELRSKGFYGYGRYEVSMKAIKNDGVVSSFFTYTGPSDNNPWDEIDIEILGKDTTKVQFNYYTSGRGNHEKMIDLGFDASEDFHTYAFEWRKDRIDWFVDGELVYSASSNLPVTESKIMMNAWCGTGVDGWLKAFDDSNLPITAEYEWITFAPIEY